MKPVLHMFTHSKAPTLTTIKEGEALQKPTNAYGWYVNGRAKAGLDMRRIPTYADIRQAKVLDGFKVVEAAETLVKMRKSDEPA